MYKLIALDIDGTLLTQTRKVQDSTKKAVAYAQDKGVLVILSTGRILGEARAFATEIHADPFAITSSGGTISDFSKNVNIHNEKIDFESGLAAALLLERYGFSSFAYADGEMIITSETAKRMQYYNQGEGSMAFRTVTDDIPAYLSEKGLCVEKFFAKTEDISILARVRSELLEDSAIDITSSGPDNIEIIKKGVHKGSSLRILAAKLGIAMEEIIAIGDSDNDYEMLEVVGMPVAMANANNRILSIAKHITTDNDNDGIANAIYHLIK